MRRLDKDYNTQKSKLNLNHEIDYDRLKSEIEKAGPLRIGQPDQDSYVHIDIYPCSCASETCLSDIIQVTHSVGHTSLTTHIDKEALLEAKSLNGFYAGFIQQPFAYFSSSQERQQIEGQIQEHLGFAPMDLYHELIQRDELPEKIQYSEDCKNDGWRAHTLLVLLDLLCDQRGMLDEYDEIDVAAPFGTYFEDAEDFLIFLNFVYDLGFLSGRLISEYFIRYEIQPLAEKGEAAEKAQEKRSTSGGSATKAKSAFQKELCKELIIQAVSEKGLEFIMASMQEKANTIREIAKRDRNAEFTFRGDELLSENWFRDRLEDLNADGALSSIVKQGMNKA